MLPRRTSTAQTLCRVVLQTEMAEKKYSNMDDVWKDTHRPCDAAVCTRMRSGIHVGRLRLPHDVVLQLRHLRRSRRLDHLQGIKNGSVDDS